MNYDRVVFNRRLLITAHAVLAFLSAFVYLDRMNLSDISYTGSRAGLGLALVAAPAMIPYILSAIHSWQVVTERRIGLFLFLAILVAGTVLGALVITGAIDMPTDGLPLFWLLLFQTVTYFGAGQVLLRTEWL